MPVSGHFEYGNHLLHEGGLRGNQQQKWNTIMRQWHALPQEEKDHWNNLAAINRQNAAQNANEHENQELAIENGNQELVIENGNQELAVENGNQELAIENGNQELVIENGNQELVIQNTTNRNAAAIIMMLLLSILIYRSFQQTLTPPSPTGQGKSGYREFESRQFFGLAAASYNLHDSFRLDCIKNSFPRDEQWHLHSNHQWRCDSSGNPCQFLAAISFKSKRMGIAFRGTTSKNQLITQFISALNYEPADSLEWTEGEVNSYYNYALDRLWHTKIWIDLMTNGNYSNFTIIFTGHSLGGALATIAAVRTVSEGFRSPGQVHLFTFGEPRVGNYKFAKIQEQKINKSFRVVHQGDLVAHLPPCWPKERGFAKSVFYELSSLNKKCRLYKTYTNL